MLRRHLSTLRVGADLFPSPQSVLPKADPWSLMNSPRSLTSSDGASYFSSVLVKKDFRTAWYLFTQTRRQLKADTLSKLLSILPSGSETATEWWPRAQQIRHVIESRGIRLTTSDYAVLINLAARAGDLPAVDDLWLRMLEDRVPRDTNVWNQYIMAVCDANAHFWPWPRSKSTSFSAAQAHNLRRSKPVPVIDMLERMELEDIPRNDRTFELVILALARQGSQNLAAVEQLISKLWLDSPNAPSLSALTSIINSFAFHSQLEKGLDIVKSAIQKYPDGLGLGSLAASRFWIRLLRLVVVQTQPRGNLPRSTFHDVWKLMLSQKATPNLGMWTIYVEYMESKNQFNTMVEALPEILRISGGDALAQSTLSRAVTGLANTDRAMDGLKAVQQAKAYGMWPEKDLEGYLAQRGATAQQLELFEEDDDEDHIGGF